MKTVLIFAGTTEGRILAEIFDRSKMECHVAVATEYGRDVLDTSDRITVHSGRLDEEAMIKLFKDINCEIVVDATHPYSSVVTDTIKKSCESLDVEYLRLLRENNVEISGKGISVYEDAQQCIDTLKMTEGNILLTTGSKQIPLFAEDEQLRKRIIARVLPSIESLEICSNAGLEGRQIIAVQGPFSREMNQVTIKEYDIRHIVSRESGTVGGADTKLQASIAEGIQAHIIKRPDEGNKTSAHNNQGTMSLGQVVNALENRLECVFDRGEMNIALAGIGPGAKKLMTAEVESAIKNADVIFGAKRMLEGVHTNAKKYEYYLKDDIIPILEKIQNDGYRNTNAVILFSGDTGFFSGCRKMYNALKEYPTWNVRILPGISSISTLCARLGMDYQDGKILSLHGRDESIWISEIKDSIRYNYKTFFITSGAEDINRLGEIIEELNITDAVIGLGYNLSYENEEVMMLTSDQCAKVSKDGLYVGVVVNNEKENRLLVPVLTDEDFIREKVPMTKEEVRKISICQLKVKENDVIYDIGSGTGSVAVQIASLSQSVKVFAVECEDAAVELIKRNVIKAGLSNVEIINAKAPDRLASLPKADACFIGGSKGNLKEILNTLLEINPQMRVVMNAVSMESICEMMQLLKTLPIKSLSAEQVSVTSVKELGNYHMMSSNNPVFIFSFDFDI